MLTTVGHAQSAPEKEGTALEEIIVTATKREENVQRVPISVTVVSSETIASQNLTQTSDLVRVAPSVTFTAGPLAIANIFSIRGIGTFASNSGLEPSVGVVVDGVPMARAVGSINDLNDLDHVEVLNGPQGTLFGKNASAGVISIATNAPKMGVSEFISRASYSSFNNIQMSGTANLPISDTIAARVTMFHDEHDGLTHAFKLDKNFGDLNTTGVRAKVRFEPSSDLNFTLTGEAVNHRENGMAVSIVGLNTSNPAFPNSVAPPIAAYEESQGIVIGHDNNQTSTTRPDLQTYGNTRSIGEQFNYEIGGNTLTGLASWRRVQNFDAFEGSGAGGPQFFPDNLSDDRNNIRQITAELRLASAANQRFRYVVGGFFQDMRLLETFRLDTQTTTGPPGAPPVLNALSYFAISSEIGIKTKNYAAFGEGTFDITDRLRVTAGSRVAHDDVSGSLDRNVLRGPSGALPPFLTGPGGPFGPIFLNTSTKYTNVSGRGSLQYDVAEDAMLYVTVSRGYKGPGVDYGYTSTAGGTVEPEIATSYELGLKSTFDRRLRVNVAVFDTTLTNFQISIPTPQFGPGSFAIRNARQLKSAGAELGLDAQVSDGFNLSASTAYTHARFTDFSNSGCFPGQTVAQGCVGDFQSVNGSALPNAPKWVSTASARYETAISGRFSAHAQISGIWQSEVLFGTDRDVNTIQAGYGIVNLLVGVDTTDHRYGMSVFANNLFDKHYLSNIGSSGNGSYYTANQVIGAYRSIGVSVDARF